MPIMVDPTLIMTKRGQDWVLRASASGSSPSIWCSAAYIEAASRPEGANLRTYKRWGMRFWSSYHYIAPELATSLRPVYGNFDRAMPLQFDQFDSVDAQIMLDIWRGVAAGHWLF